MQYRTSVKASNITMGRRKFQARSKKRSDRKKQQHRDLTVKKPTQLVVKIPLDLLPQDTQQRLRRQTQHSDGSASCQTESQDLKREEKREEAAKNLDE